MVFTETFDADVMFRFLDRLAGHFDRKVHLVVDGHSAHRSRKVRVRLADSDATDFRLANVGVRDRLLSLNKNKASQRKPRAKIPTKRRTPPKRTLPAAMFPVGSPRFAQRAPSCPLPRRKASSEA